MLKGVYLLNVSVILYDKEAKHWQIIIWRLSPEDNFYFTAYMAKYRVSRNIRLKQEGLLMRLSC